MGSKGSRPEDIGGQEGGVSALHDSIVNKGETSYYFAHATRDTGEALAPPPVHRVIAKEACAVPDNFTRITSFQFLDDGDWVKVYLPLDNLDSISQENLTVTLEERSACVEIRGLQENVVLQFLITELQHAIVVVDSCCKILKTKIMLKLKKAAVGSDLPTWTNIRT